VILTIWRTLVKTETPNKTRKMLMISKTMMAPQALKMTDHITAVPVALNTRVQTAMPMTKKAESKMAREDEVDLSTGSQDRKATPEEDQTREGTFKTTEMLTQKHSHKYISLVLKRTLVRTT